MTQQVGCNMEAHFQRKRNPVWCSVVAQLGNQRRVLTQVQGNHMKEQPGSNLVVGHLALHLMLASLELNTLGGTGNNHKQALVWGFQRSAVDMRHNPLQAGYWVGDHLELAQMLGSRLPMRAGYILELAQMLGTRLPMWAGYILDREVGHR